MFSKPVRRGETYGGRVMTEVERKLRGFFAEEKNISLAFLFGSQSRGRARPDSDVDVAALFEEAPSSEEVFDLRERLVSLLDREVDMVVLNGAGPIIKMQVLKTGIKLKSLRGGYEQFFVRTINDYGDFKLFRAPIERAVARRRIYG